MKRINFDLSGVWLTREVFLNGQPLKPERSQKIRNHSPDGFAWGYSGSGPAQLALAILLELIPEPNARLTYQAFKNELIARLPQADFYIRTFIDQRRIHP